MLPVTESLDIGEMVIVYSIPLGSVPNGVEASEKSVSASEGSRDTLRFHKGELNPPSVSSSRPRLLLDIVSEILLLIISLSVLNYRDT